MSTQPDTRLAGTGDGPAAISSTPCPHQFTWSCRRCRTHGLIAWATNALPPTWQTRGEWEFGEQGGPPS
jgi:hypothetical protein